MKEEEKNKRLEKEIKKDLIKLKKETVILLLIRMAEFYNQTIRKLLEELYQERMKKVKQSQKGQKINKKYVSYIKKE